MYVELLVRCAHLISPVTPSIAKQAASASQYGLQFADAVHLFVAKDAGYDRLVTTDIRFIR